MGYGDGHFNTRGYYDDYFEAESTNSGCDVKIDNPEHLVKDLEKVGFVDIKFEITQSFSDFHDFWIFVKAYKP
jgi:hypothetical protein